MSLIKCKECGKEISKDAKSCPHCRKKVEKNNLFLEIIGVIFILLMFGASHESTSENITYQKISLKEIEQKLQENAARAQQQYQNMYVEFQGRIKDIDADGKYFTVDSGTFLGVHCSISDKHQKEVLLRKNVGSVVNVKGRIRDVGNILGYRLNVIEIQ